MGWEVGGRFKREGTYVYLWLSHINVRQKPTQYCKAIILQFKKNKVKKPYETHSNTHTHKPIFKRQNNRTKLRADPDTATISEGL